MTNPPPLPPLNYAPPPSNQPNAPRKVLLRIVAGTIAGAGCCFAGLALAGATNQAWTFFIPFTLTLAAAIFVALRYRRFGYITGIIIAPFIIAGGLFLLLLIICGLGPFKT